MKFFRYKPALTIGRITKISTLTLSAAMSFSATSASGLWDYTPKDFLGENRILVICGDAKPPSEVDWIEFEVRDLIAIEVYDEELLYLYRINQGKPVSSAFLSSERFNKLVKCSDKAEFILIGKDSGIKKRWQDTLAVDDLFQTIDAMPMRQFEMKTRDVN